MSQYEGRRPQALIRPNQPVQIPSQGITESLAAPGLATPVIQQSRGAIEFQQLERSLGLAGSLGSEIGTIANQQRAEQDRIDEKAKAADYGNAAVSVGSQLPSILGQIDDGTLVTTPNEIVQHIAEGQSDAFRQRTAELVTGHVATANQRRLEFVRTQNENDQISLHAAGSAGGSLSDYEEALKASHDIAPNRSGLELKSGIVKAGLDSIKSLALSDPAAAREKLGNLTEFAGKPFAADVMIARNHIDAAEIQKENRDLSTLSDNVGKYLDAGVPAAQVEQYVADEAARLGVNAHALRRSITSETRSEADQQQADTNRAESELKQGLSAQAAALELKGEYGKARSLVAGSSVPADFKLALADRISAQENHGDETARKAAEDRVRELVATNLNEGNFSGAAKGLSGARGSVKEQVIYDQFEKIRTAQKQAIEDSKLGVKQQLKEQAIQEAMSGAQSLLSQGRGGLIQDFHRDAPDGTTLLHKTKNELLDTAMNQQLAKIESDGNDQQAQAVADGLSVGDSKDRIEAKMAAAQRQVAADQMRLISQNAYAPPRFKASIESGADSLSIAAFADTQAGQAVPLSPLAIEGFRTFKRFAAQAPGVLDSMHLSARTDRIYRAAVYLQGIEGVGSDEKQALLNATRAADRAPSDSETARIPAVQTALNLAAGGDPFLMRDAAPIAEIFSRLGLPPDQAVAQAIKAKSARIDINGWTTAIGNIPADLKGEFRTVARDLVAQYAFENKDAGINPRHLSFQYDPMNNLWQMVNARTMLTVPSDHPDKVFLTTEDLIRRAHRLQSDPDVQRALFEERARARGEVNRFKTYEPIKPLQF